MYPATLDLLACPECGGPLRAHPITTAPDGEWLDGVLRSDRCGRWFRMENGIADLVRDGLREIADDRAFLGRHHGAIDAPASGEWRPFGPDGSAPQHSPADLAIIEEGRHWGRFMQHFWDAGDRAIFDLAHRGDHPFYYIAGVLATDDRDHRRRWANFSDRAGAAIFPLFERLAGRRAVDVGCGGGQFGLAAARAGMEVIGFDPSFQEVSLGRRHARNEGITRIDYLRAEPANPPFRADVFDALLAKDSLHHVPALDAAMPRLAGLLVPGGWLILHEHVARAGMKEWLLNRLRPAAVRKIRSRYAKVEIPPELLRDSANEDISADRVRPLAHEYFEPVDVAEDLYLANELEIMAHMAFGRRQWVSAPVYPVALAVEKLLVALGERQHLTFTGRLRCPAASLFQR